MQTIFFDQKKCVKKNSATKFNFSMVKNLSKKKLWLTTEANVEGDRKVSNSEATVDPYPRNADETKEANKLSVENADETKEANIEDVGEVLRFRGNGSSLSRKC